MHDFQIKIADYEIYLVKIPRLEMLSVPLKTMNGRLRCQREIYM